MESSTENKPDKIYFTISEVAATLSVNESTLRHWEKEFTILSPKRSNKNVRKYTKKDIEIVEYIHHLLKVKKLKLEGVKELLSKRGLKPLQENYQAIEQLKSLRDELNSWIEELD